MTDLDLANLANKEQLEAAVESSVHNILMEISFINRRLAYLAQSVEDLGDIAIVLGRIDEPTIPWDEMKKRLKD